MEHTFKTFGTMLDCSRNAVMTAESVKRWIDLTAKLGCNTLHLYMEDTYEVDGRRYFRIIDYKSGSGTTTFSSIESLFNKEEKDRAKAVMQVFMYCWMYAHFTENKGKTIQPGIYYVRSLFSDPFDPSVYHRIERGKSEKVEDFSGYAQAFEEGLRGCLDEIFNPEIPFTQTPTGKACSYCPFKGICGK